MLSGKLFLQICHSSDGTYVKSRVACVKHKIDCIPIEETAAVGRFRSLSIICTLAKLTAREMAALFRAALSCPFFSRYWTGRKKAAEPKR